MGDSPGLIAAALVAVALAAGLVVYFRRPSAAERERRRRLQVHRQGRITDGTIVDVVEPDAQGVDPSAHLVHYTYSIGGVNYEAWQDLAALRAHIGDSRKLIGSVYVKYQSKNPGNSIILCEEWSGLRSSGRDGTRRDEAFSTDRPRLRR